MIVNWTVKRKFVFREIKDYVFIAFGLVLYALGWTVFMLPYQIMLGGVTGIGAIIYYATGFPLQWTFFIINILLLAVALKVLGLRFCLKTIYAVFMLTFLLWLFQLLFQDGSGNLPQILGPGEDFMSCLIGASLCGVGVGIVFSCNGSTGGTDIIAAIINKYRTVTLGHLIMACDVLVVSSCFFVFHDWRRVIFGFVALFVIGIVIDYVVNSARQSVQFIIISKDYEKIATHIANDIGRGVTLLNATGWYSKQNIPVLLVLAYKRQAVSISRLVKDLDPNAFVSQSAVIGVYGEGFDKLKGK